MRIPATLRTATPSTESSRKSLVRRERGGPAAASFCAKMLYPHSTKPRQGGFTLIELLVVIGVVAILAAVVVLNLLGVKSNANQTACKGDRQTVQSAADAYHTDHGTFAVGLADLVPTYLKVAPNDLGTVDLNADGHGTVAASGCP